MLDINPERQFEDIRLIIKDLLKVVKVVSLYPESNPLPQSLKRSFAEKFENVIDDYGDIKLFVEKETLTYAGEVVFSDHNKEEALVSLLFDAGILTITFKSGLDVNDIYRFLDVIKEGINTPGQNFDLVNKLWEAELPNISMTTAEDIALAAYDGDLSKHVINIHGREKNLNENLPDNFNEIFVLKSDDDDDLNDAGEYEVYEVDLEDFDESQLTKWTPGDGKQPGTHTSAKSGKEFSTALKVNKARKNSNNTVSKPTSSLSIPGADNEELKILEATEAMGFSASENLSDAPAPPDTTLILNDQFQLSDEEESKVKLIIDEDALFDPWQSIADLACELLHQEDEMSAFYETVSVVERVMTELITNAKLSEADKILAYIGKLKEQIKSKKPLWSERLRDAIVTTGSKERLIVLIHALNRHPEISPNAIKRYLSRFGWESLGAVTDMLADLKHDAHKEAVRTHLSSLGGKNIQIISRGIYDKRIHVVKNAIQVLVAVADPQVLKHLRKAADHKETEIRLELVKALKTSPIPQTLDILVELARDRKSVVRQEAVNIIVQRRGQAAFDAITRLINDEEFGIQTHADRLDLLIAYSKLGGEHSLEYLRKLAMQYNPLFGTLIEKLREEAFEALAHNTSDRAGRLLIKLTGSWRPVVKNLAIIAIHKRREIIYGGDDDSSN